MIVVREVQCYRTVHKNPKTLAYQKVNPPQYSVSLLTCPVLHPVVPDHAVVLEVSERIVECMDIRPTIWEVIVSKIRCDV